jgi:ABC-type proline/glycine betaine transport system permease subunit
LFAFFAIGGTATLSALGAPIWIVIVGAAALALASASEHRKLAGIYNFTLFQIMLFGGWRSILHSVAACSAAYVLGHLALLTV